MKFRFVPNSNLLLKAPCAILSLGGMMLCALPAPLRAAPLSPLVADKPIALAGERGGFDFMQVDLPKNRLLIGHSKNNTFDVFNLKTGAELARIPSKGAQGIAIDPVDGKYFVTNGDGESVTVVDRNSLKKLQTIPLSGPGDDALYNEKNGTVYVAHDDGANLWTIDAKTNRLTGSIPIPGVPEVLAFDRSANRIFLNIKDKNQVAVIDPRTNRVTHLWEAGAASPHGLQLDEASHRLFVAGGTGQFSVLDSRSGRLIKSLAIAPRVDQMAFDRSRGRFFCASGTGFLSVVKMTSTVVQLEANVPVPKGAHTVAADTLSHSVWICYGTGSASYIQKFRAR